MLCARLTLALLGILSAAAARATAEPLKGVVVESVGEVGAAHAADLRPGDVVIAWSRAGGPPADSGAHGDVLSPLDLWMVEWEQAPRGAVTLALRRGGVATTATIGPGEWRLEARPALRPEALTLYERGQPGGGGDLEAWRTLAGEKKLPPRTRAWLLARIAERLEAVASRAEADEAYARARQAADAPLDRLVLALVRGRDLRGRGEHRRALQVIEAALSESPLPSSLAAAAIHLEAGEAAAEIQSSSLVVEHFQHALEVSEREARGSLLHAVTLTRRCGALYGSGDFVGARQMCEAALAIYRGFGSASLDLAENLHSLGMLAHWQGRADEAESLLAEALALRERLDPGSPKLAFTLGAFAKRARERGDLAGAEAARNRAMAVLEKASAEGRGVPGWIVATQTQGLAEIAFLRGDLDRAQDLYQRSLSQFESTPGPDVGRAITNMNLGLIAIDRGDFAAADGFLVASLADLAPRSLWAAGALQIRAELAAKRGDWANAEALLGQAVEVAETQAGGSEIEADCVQRLGRVAEARGDFRSAEALYRRALRILERLAPGSQALAESLNALGRLARRERRLEEAEGFLRRAVDALDEQKGRTGGAEDVRAGFAAKYTAFYQDLLEVLFERGDQAAAFHVLERARARLLLALMAERELIAPDLPAGLDRERRATQRAYEIAQAELASLGLDSERVDALQARLRELRDRRAEIGEQVRRLSPRFQAVHYPAALEWQAAEAALDDGTLLLSYAVGEDATYVFVLAARSTDQARPVLSARRLPLGREALRERVSRLRTLVQTQGSPREIEPLASELYQLLVEPVWSDIARSRRVVICPDGPLWTLPFGALLRQRRPLIEWKPIHLAASATVYAQLRTKREKAGSPATARLVAFGDPVYPDHVEVDPARPQSLEVQEQLRRGRSLTALQGTRREVEEIVALFGKGARSFLGPDATEENVAKASDAQYVHFACHGLLNERFPLDSSLALTIPKSLAEGQENGLLQAWEIFERVRLQAELVTLSACESGLGVDMGGEGLVGLVQAFQVAGARSVVASLWGVPDRSTARFMKRFYQLLQAGQPKDEALRAAQLEFIRAGGLSAHPFRWAAFQLFGDWR